MRLVGEFHQGKCSVGIKEVNMEDPLYTIKGGENAFVFLTQYYSPHSFGDQRLWCWH